MGYQIDLEILADQMLREGVTKAQLARAAGLSKQYVSDICSGNRQPREDKVRAIAEALNVHPRALLLRTVSAPQSATLPDESAAVV